MLISPLNSFERLNCSCAFANALTWDRNILLLSVTCLEDISFTQCLKLCWQQNIFWSHKWAYRLFALFIFTSYHFQGLRSVLACKYKTSSNPKWVCYNRLSQALKAWFGKSDMTCPENLSGVRGNSNTLNAQGGGLMWITLSWGSPSPAVRSTQRNFVLQKPLRLQKMVLPRSSKLHFSILFNISCFRKFR